MRYIAVERSVTSLCNERTNTFHRSELLRIKSCSVPKLAQNLQTIFTVKSYNARVWIANSCHPLKKNRHGKAFGRTYTGCFIKRNHNLQQILEGAIWGRSWFFFSFVPITKLQHLTIFKCAAVHKTQQLQHLNQNSEVEKNKKRTTATKRVNVSDNCLENSHLIRTCVSCSCTG